MIQPSSSTLFATKPIRFVAITLMISSSASFVAKGAEDHPPASVSTAAASSAAQPASTSSPAHVENPAHASEAVSPAETTVPAEPAHLIPIAAAYALPPAAQTLSDGISAREAQGLVNLGSTLTDRSDFDAAEIAYRQVLKGNAPLDHTQSALLGLARMHRKKGELTKAAAIYERFLKDFPSNNRVPDALLELGRTLRDMGAPRLAIARFYNVINSTLKLPSNGGFEHYQTLAKTAQFEVAETHFQSGDFVEANKFFSRLRMLDLAPSDRARAHFKAGYSLHLAADFEGAVTGLRSYIDQWPTDENVPEARYLLAITLRSLKRPQEALAATLELLRSEQSRSGANAKRWTYWQRRTGNQLANEFFQGGDILNALAIYHGLAALSDDPTWRVPVAYQIALCYERLSDAERACKTYHTILDTAGTNSSPDIADVARMASARLGYVEWRNQTNAQVAALFDSTTGVQAPSVSKPSTPYDPDRSTPSAPATL